STGGFTEVWLERGARRVVAVDVGTDQMAPRLRANPRVTLWEQTDVRALSPAAAEDAELCSADVSFLSLLAVLAAGPVRALSRRGGEIVALVKPQFECGPRARDKHGVVRRLSDHVRALNAVADGARALGYRVSGLIPSPITGGDGNVEYLLYLAGTEAAPDAAAVAGEAFRLFRPAGADRSGPKQTTPQSGGKK
ncbi:MAG: TlyA family RNA methyltransferase, partial [Oscillospiraceae bacterium]|nr:TlyA family RNA methyltransferase [Oscillospiraceae bacterium]